MIQTINIPKKMNFEEFVDWYPQDSSERYELHNGEIVQMPLPKGKHSQVAGCLMSELSLEIRRLKLPYFIPRKCLIKTDADLGYQPDVIVLNKNKIAKEPLWEKQSTLIVDN
jgi:Uma2 family endonuclease